MKHEEGLLHVSCLHVFTLRSAFNNCRYLDSRHRRVHTASPMSRAIILQHAAHAAPGRIVPIFRDFGIPTETRKLWQGDEVPTDLDEVRLLVVLGGMKFADVTNEKFPYLATEVKTLQRMVG